MTSESSTKTSFADVPEKEYHYMIEHAGYTEETFLTCSLVPLIGPIDGMFSIVTELTKQR
jgi:gamma-glutamyl:cysteine ligase YbdK (ATP-grasp superfamily)